jgi:hypothetical protein
LWCGEISPRIVNNSSSEVDFTEKRIFEKQGDARKAINARRPRGFRQFLRYKTVAA